MLPVRKFVKGRGGKWHDVKGYSKKGLQMAIKKRQMMELLKEDPSKFYNYIEGNPRIRPADKERYITEAIEMMHLGRGGVIRGKHLRKNKNKR